jgi:cytochrome c2
MKTFFKITLRFLGFLVVVIGILAAYIQIKGIPTYSEKVAEIPQNYKFVSTPEKVAKGMKIASMLCGDCHMSEQEQRFSGKELHDMPDFFGKAYSMNITQDTVKGIGNWTDGELLYYLRTGIRSDGSFAVFMPKFPLMADEDMEAVIAFLRSSEAVVQPSKLEPPICDYSFFSKILANTIFKPAPFTQTPKLIPPVTDKVAHGKYLATALYDCAGCHSADFITNDEFDPTNNKGFFGGGNKFKDLDGNEIKSANITFDTETGIGNWTAEEFITAVKYGKSKNGMALRYPMLPKTVLDSAEIRAIYAYLKTVPAIKNQVKIKTATSN